MLSKGRQMWFKALLPVTVDLPAVWERIHNYNRVNLGGEDSKYTVYFTGTIDEGLEVLRVLLETADINVQVNTNF